MKLGLGRDRCVGLVWEAGRVAVVQAARVNDSLVVERSAELAIGPGAMDDPKVLGGELRKALRSAGFSARRAVVGLPARDILALEIPAPAPGTDARAALEKELGERLAVDLKDLVYSAGATGKAGERIFVVAATRRLVEGLTSAMAAAGLRIQSFAPSALVWLAEQNASGTEAHVLRGADFVDLAALRDGDPVLLRAFRPSLQAPPEAERARLLLELRRATWGLRQASAELLPVAAAAPPRCVAWRLAPDLPPLVLADPAATQADDLALAEVDASLPGRVQWPARSNPQRFALAAALSSAGLSGSRLPWSLAGVAASAPPRRAKRQRVLAAAAGVALLVAVAAGWFDLNAREAEVAALDEQVARIDPEVKEAEKFTERVRFGLKWFDARPSFLAGLSDATLAFPEEGGAWASSYSAREGMPCVIACKGASNEAAFALLDKLKKNPNLIDAKLLELREAGGKSSEVSFTVTFRRKEGN